MRSNLGYADYLGALQRYRAEYPRDLRLLTVSHFLINYPFADRLFPNSLAVIDRVKKWGPAVILSDGDVVFQPRKIQHAGLWDVLHGDVLIYTHKQAMLEAMQQRYPAAHYVMVDDKPQILIDMKQRLGDRLTTVFVRQGHYALDPEELARYPSADVTLEHIGELAAVDPGRLSGIAAPQQVR